MASALSGWTNTSLCFSCLRYGKRNAWSFVCNVCCTHDDAFQSNPFMDENERTCQSHSLSLFSDVLVLHKGKRNRVIWSSSFCYISSYPVSQLFVATSPKFMGGKDTCSKRKLKWKYKNNRGNQGIYFWRICFFKFVYNILNITHNLQGSIYINIYIITFYF